MGGQIIYVIIIHQEKRDDIEGDYELREDEKKNRIMIKILVDFWEGTRRLWLEMKNSILRDVKKKGELTFYMMYEFGNMWNDVDDEENKKKVCIAEWLFELLE